MNYPGDNADPKAVAKYFESVALSYDLPGILPVMTSYVELTVAWATTGDVKQVDGYLYAVDYQSVGYFQQQSVFGWGTYEQLINAEYAVHRFCEEAVKFVDDEWHSGTTDPDALGRWCQAVQRSAEPDAYRDKGYPGAVGLLEDNVAIEVDFDSSGWGKDKATGAWIQTEANQTLYTNKNGYLWKKARWKWPTANTPPNYNSYWYVERHPTRYSWRSDIEEWARYLVDNYDVWCNTYYDHPEGWGRDTTSIDVWGSAGRGSALHWEVRQAVFDDMFYAEGAPYIEWLISNGWMWTRAGGWSWFSDDASDADMGHWLHMHITYQ